MFHFQSDKEFEFSRDHFYKFMFVRHPMERLVSCYFDKMVTNPHKSLKAFRRAVKIRAEKIMARALKNDSKENENETNLRRKRNVVYTSGLKFE